MRKMDKKQTVDKKQEKDNKRRAVQPIGLSLAAQTMLIDVLREIASSTDNELNGYCGSDRALNKITALDIRLDGEREDKYEDEEAKN